MIGSPNPTLRTTVLGRAGKLLNVKWTAEGDSITIGLGGVPAWPFVALGTMPGATAPIAGSNNPSSSSVSGVGTVNLNDIATSGISLLTISQNYASRGGASFDATKDLNLFSIMAGTNTSGANDTSATQKYILLRGILRAAEATGFQRRIVGTITARNDDGGTTWTNTLTPLNALIRTYYSNDMRCDGLIDFGNDPRFNSTTAASDPTYYDTVTPPINLHPNIAGEAAMGSIAEPVALAALKGAGARSAYPMTWSIFDISANLALSNSNRTLTVSSSAGAFTAAAFFAMKTGKWCWETKIEAVTTEVTVGIVNEAFAFDNSKHTNNSPNAMGCNQGGSIQYNSSLLATGDAFAAGDVIQHCYDADAKKYSVRRNRSGTLGNWNGNASADPATGVGALDASVLGNGYIHPAAHCYTGASSVTSNFTAAQMVTAIPTGFKALDQ